MDIWQVGIITKQWTGFGKEAFTDADNFGISFPLDLDVKVRRIERERVETKIF